MNKKRWILTGFLFVVFAVFTVLVKKVSIAPIGLNDTLVGFAGINGSVARMVGFSDFWYQLTEKLGLLALAVMAAFAVTGLVQWIGRKSLAAVDKDLFVLAGFYVLLGLVYVFFEKVVVINFRPVILDEGLEASYPSSHTMLAICVFYTAMLQLQGRVKNKTLLTVLEIVLTLLLIVTVVGRLLSGVHWFTDIVGGVLLSLALISLYSAAVSALKE